MRTQIAFRDPSDKAKYAALVKQARRLGARRTEVWQRFGSIQGMGL